MFYFWYKKESPKTCFYKGVNAEFPAAEDSTYSSYENATQYSLSSRLLCQPLQLPIKYANKRFVKSALLLFCLQLRIFSYQTTVSYALSFLWSGLAFTVAYKCQHIFHQDTCSIPVPGKQSAQKGNAGYLFI